MKHKKKKDLIAYTAFSIFGIVLWFAIPILIPGEPGFSIDSRLFPRIIAVLFIVIGGVSAVSTFLYHQNSTDKEEECDDIRSHPYGTLRVITMSVIMVAYAFLIEPIGFIVATAFAVTAVMLIEGVKKFPLYIAVYATSAGLYCIFRYLLYVQL